MNWFSFIIFVLAAVLGVHSFLDNLKCPPVTIPRGRVRLRSRGRIAKYSCVRGYQLLGEKYSTCLRGRWDSPPPVCISTGCPSLNNMQNAQVLESYRGALVKIQCDPGYKIIGSSSLYCNGRSWNGTQPYCEEIKYSVNKWCDFESEDLCGWTHDQNHDFDWRRHNFATPSGHVGTGPAFDHTLGPGHDGHYMYLETSSPRLENDTARLFSPEYPPSTKNDSCFEFWYHMYGATTGSLHVYLHTHDTTLLFSESGDHGNHWIKGIIPLPFIPTSFQIIIEGVRGPGYVGDTAIDDVKLTEGEECTNTSPGVPGSCEGRCYTSKVPTHTACECHQNCSISATCCPDFIELCGIVSTQTAGLMPFSSNISSEHVTVASVTSSFIFPLSTATSHKSTVPVLPERRQYHTPATIAKTSFTKSPLIVGQTTDQNLSLFEIYDNKFENQTTSPIQKYTLSFKNDSNILNANNTYFSEFIPTKHRFIPIEKDETGNYINEVSTSFTPLSDSADYSPKYKTDSEHKIIQSAMHTFVSSESLPTSETGKEPYVNASRFKETVTKLFSQTIILPFGSTIPTTVTTPTPKASTAHNSPKLTLPKVNLSPIIQKFSVGKTSTIKPVLSFTRSLGYSKIPEYVNTKNDKLRNISYVLPQKTSTLPPNTHHQNNGNHISTQNKSVSYLTAVTSIYKLFPPELPKAKNDVLYPVWVKSTYSTRIPIQFPTSKLQVTSAMHIISTTNSKRNLYSSVPVLTTTVSYKRTNTPNKLSVYVTPTKWLSKYKPKGTVEKFSAQTSHNMIAGIGTACGVVMFLLIGAAAVVVIIRRHKIKRRNNFDNEESDHLTADEVLDLTWCGPAQPLQQECTILEN